MKIIKPSDYLDFINFLIHEHRVQDLTILFKSLDPSISDENIYTIVNFLIFLNS